MTIASWMQVIDVGHTSVMVPLAGAIAAWLALHRAWKPVLWWCALFGGGLVLVACSKIAFLGWGLEIAPLRFQALSGHAYRATAVIPVAVFLVLRQAPRGWRRAGVLMGFAASMGLGALLVVFGKHTTSEVVASFTLGAMVAAIFMTQAASSQPWTRHRWAAPLALVVLALVVALKPAKLNPRLVDVALHLSGRDDLYRWASVRARFPASKENTVTECRVHLPQHGHRQ